MHLLLRIPAVASRADVAQRVLTAASAVARRAGVVRPWHHRLWQEPAWCAFVRNGTAVSHLRRQITSRKAVRTAGSAAD